MKHEIDDIITAIILILVLLILPVGIGLTAYVSNPEIFKNFIGLLYYLATRFTDIIAIVAGFIAVSYLLEKKYLKKSR